MMVTFWDNERFVSRALTYVIRSDRTGTDAFLTQVRQAVWSVNGNLPLALVRTLQDVYEQSMARTTFAMVMLAIAGAMALLLGLIGLYGVISYALTYVGVSAVLVPAAVLASYLPARRAAALDPVEALRAE